MTTAEQNALLPQQLQHNNNKKASSVSSSVSSYNNNNNGDSESDSDSVVVCYSPHCPLIRQFHVSQLSLSEKLSLLSGSSLWDVALTLSPLHSKKSKKKKKKTQLNLQSTPTTFDADAEQEEDDRITRLSPIVVSDGPHGIRKLTDDTSYLKESIPATCFPPACALACSWNTELSRQVGKALGNEAWELDVSIVLGPGLNLKRHPGGGRNFEYFSEDPLLSGRMASAMIQGIQTPIPIHRRRTTSNTSTAARGPTAEAADTAAENNSNNNNNNDQQQLLFGSVGACAKHFCVNNQESHRFVVDAILDERTGRELYYRGFEYVVRGVDSATSSTTTTATETTDTQQQQPFQQPATIMCAYNKVNGHHCSEQVSLNQHLLRQEWGFEGVLLTDWGATNNRLKGIVAGVDLEMPGSHGAHDRAIRDVLRNEKKKPSQLLLLQQQQQQKDCEEEENQQRPDEEEVPVVPTTTLASTERIVTYDNNNNDDVENLVANGSGDDDPLTTGGETRRRSLQSHIDESAQRVLDLITTYQGAAAAKGIVGIDDNNNDDGTANNETNDVGDDQAGNSSIWAAHNDLARRAAQECIVLLQNKRDMLPLRFPTSTVAAASAADDDDVEVATSSVWKIAVIGAFARDHPRFQGMGSSQVNAHSVLTAYEALEQLLLRHNQQQQHGCCCEILYAPGYKVDKAPGVIEPDLIQDAVRVAREANVVLLFCGLDEISESEGFDRTELGLPSQHVALIEAICQNRNNNNNPVALILSNGGAVVLPDSCCVGDGGPDAILEGYLLGQAGGGAMIDVLFGRVSPSGKLAETMPLRNTDILADQYFPGDRNAVEYREGLDVGYRYFDTANVPVRFPFGHGLSYTTFEYSNLQITVLLDEDEQKEVEIKFDLLNAGSVAGSEVVQCYVHDVQASVYRPVHELREFQKIALEPGERKCVTMRLNQLAFAFYDIGCSKWSVEPGAFQLQIGSSSRDIRLSGRIVFTKGTMASELSQNSYPPLEQGGTLSSVDDSTFALRFGKEDETVMRDVMNRRTKGIRPFDRNSLLKEIAASTILGKILFGVVYSEASKEVKPGDAQERQKKMVRANVENLPLRALVLFSQGALSFVTLDACIASMNSFPLLAIQGFMLAFLLTVADICKLIFGRGE